MSIQDQIYNALANGPEGTMRTRDIAQATGLSPRQIADGAKGLVKQGRIERPKRGLYVFLTPLPPAYVPAPAPVQETAPERPTPCVAMDVVAWRDRSIRVAPDEEMVSVRSVCETFELDIWGQQQRLERAGWATTCVMQVVDPRGHRRDHICLPRAQVPMWLATVETSRVKDPRTREALEAFQCECATVLDAYWGERQPPVTSARDLSAREYDRRMKRLSDFQHQMDQALATTGQVSVHALKTAQGAQDLARGANATAERAEVRADRAEAETRVLREERRGLEEEVAQLHSDLDVLRYGEACRINQDAQLFDDATNDTPAKMIAEIVNRRRGHIDYAIASKHAYGEVLSVLQQHTGGRVDLGRTRTLLQKKARSKKEKRAITYEYVAMRMGVEVLRSYHRAVHDWYWAQRARLDSPRATH